MVSRNKEHPKLIVASRRTLQAQENLYKQTEICQECPPIVKIYQVFVEILGPNTPLIVQENISRVKIYAVV